MQLTQNPKTELGAIVAYGETRPFALVSAVVSALPFDVNNRLLVSVPCWFDCTVPEGTCRLKAP